MLEGKFASFERAVFFTGVPIFRPLRGGIGQDVHGLQINPTDRA